MPQAIGSPATNRRSVDPATSSFAPSESYEPNEAFVTTTLKSWPSSVDVLDKTGLPFAITFHPLAESGSVCIFIYIFYKNFFLFFLYHYYLECSSC